jgi:hypothetical protein
MDWTRGITRRDFVRHTMSTALVAPALAGLGVEAFQARRPRSSLVTLVRDQKVLNASHDVDPTILGRMLDDTMMRATGERTPRAAWLSLFKPTDIIGLVPSTGTPSAAAHHWTHPEVFEAVRQRLVEAGIPAQQIRDAQHNLEAVRSSTALICLPMLKTHQLSGIGTVIKNYIMFSGRPEYYHNQNHVNLGECWTLPDVKGKTRLVLVDALRPQCDKGPQVDPQFQWDYNGLIAGTDPVAVEAISVRILLAKRRAVRGEPWPLASPPLCMTVADEKFGLGTSRIEEIKLQRAGWEADAFV